MSSVPAPVAVVTAFRDDLGPAGATVTAFASLSINPAMMVVALGRESSTLATIRASGRFGIHIMGADQVGIATLFATNQADKFALTDWTLESGVPRLGGAPGWVRLEVSRIVEGGDHGLVLGTVTDAVDAPGERLIYFRREFARVERIEGMGN